MPSPIAHSLAAVALAWLRPDPEPAGDPRPQLPGGRSGWRQDYVVLGALVLAANVPDLDFIPGILSGDPGRFHRGPAHSLLAALVCAIAAGWLARRWGPRFARRLGLLVGLSFTSHLVMDMLSTDHGTRTGVALLWPLVRGRLALPFPVFRDIEYAAASGSFFQSLFTWSNIVAMFSELVGMGLVLAIIIFFRLRIGEGSAKRAPR